jgi:hypothetical protein
MDIKYGTFHDAETGKTITRPLTPEEIAELPEPNNEFPPTSN